MPFDLPHFVRLRPFLYHLTACRNLRRIRKSHGLECARRLFCAGGQPELIRKRRRQHCELEIDGETAIVRDQSPLHPGNMKLDEGQCLEDFVEHLNGLVFFWPGGDKGPIQAGRRHYKRYKGEHPALLRVRTEDLFEKNKGKPLFCRYNSGAPRCSKGERSPRGRDTFLDAGSFPFTAGKVVETVYAGQAVLPKSTQLGSSPCGPWERLFPIC